MNWHSVAEKYVQEESERESEESNYVERFVLECDLNRFCYYVTGFRDQRGW